MALTGNELTFECSVCLRDFYLDQLSMVEMKCIKCVTEELCQSGMFSVSTLVTSTMGSVISSTTRTPKLPTLES